MNDIWNPWHGCNKYSEGCKYCYMYYLDSQRDKKGSDIYKVKTNFNLPVRKTRSGEYKVPSGSELRVCMTSDFFLEEADSWRNDVWKMIKERQDVTFWLQTKRADRVKANLPDDWGSGYDNVKLTFTAENQKRADERIPILLDIPVKYKAIMCAPMIGKITLDKYLKTGQIKLVLVDGENYDGDRPLYYDWVKLLYDECNKYNVDFDFIGTGNFFIKDNKTYRVVKAYQRVMALKSGLQLPNIDTTAIKVQPKCKQCSRRHSCNGCRWCGKCGG